MSGLYVPAKPIQYEPPLHGLIASADEIDVDARGLDHGIQLRSDYCAALGARDPDCAYWPEGVKPDYWGPGAPLLFSEHAPGEIWTEVLCDAGPRPEMEELNDVARAQLEVGQSKLLEALLWSGAFTDNPDFLSLQSTAVTGNAEALGYGQGLSAAEQSLANCSVGARGMIHAPVYVVSQWLQDGALREDTDGTLRTLTRGDIVVGGSGYSGVGPTGVPSISGNRAWIYTSGPVQYKLGEIQIVADKVEENVDRSNNTYLVRASQNALLAFDTCCVTALLVTC